MRKMENRKADNIPEKRFLQKLLEIGQVIMMQETSSYMKVSKNSCSVDLIDIKNNLKQQIYSKITSISVVQVFNLELISLLISFSRIFSIYQEPLFPGTPESVCYSLFYCNMSSNNLLYLFLQKIRSPVYTCFLQTGNFISN